MKANSSDFETGVSGMFWMGLMTICNYLIQLVILFFLSRLLSPSDYGQVAALTILIGLADLIWMLGVGPAIVQQKELTKKDITTGNSLNLLFGLIVFLLINVFSTFWVKTFSLSDELMLRVYSIVFILNSLAGVSQSLSQRKCKFKKISIIKSVSIAIYGIIAIVLAFMDYGAWSIVLATVAQALLVAVIFLILEPIPLRLGINKDSAKRLLYFGGGFTAAKFFNYLAIRGDSFVINKVMGKTDLGLYSRAQQILLYPVNLVGETLDQVLFPMLSRSKGDQVKLKRVFLNGTGVIALITAPISIIAYFRADEIVGFFLGDNWGECIDPFKILILGLFFRTGYKLSNSLIRAMGMVYRGAAIQMVYAISVIAGAYFGHFYGLVGVATGVTIAFTIHYILLTSMCMYLVKITLKDIIVTLFPAVLFSVLTTAVTLAVNELLSNIINYFFTCLVTTIFVFAVYSILILMLKRITIPKELQNFLQAILLRINIFNRRKAF